MINQEMNRQAVAPCTRHDNRGKATVDFAIMAFLLLIGWRAMEHWIHYTHTDPFTGHWVAYFVASAITGIFVAPFGSYPHSANLLGNLTCGLFMFPILCLQRLIAFVAAWTS